MGKRGSRRGANRPFWERWQRKIIPGQYLESQLVKLEKLNEDTRNLWARLQDYLASERERILDEILDSLRATAISDYTCENLSRIVGSKYARNPLSSKGSYLMPPGGRFNFGQSSSYHSYFPALYLANNFETAFLEKFGEKENYKCENSLTVLDLALRKTESFLHVRADVNLERVIDLREMDSFDAFYDSVKHLEMPREIQLEAKRLKASMQMLSSSESVRGAVLAKDYEQWDFWIDQPSPSQWLGHYVRLAGIQGIIYPTVKSEDGFNLAVFPENFEESESTIQIKDQIDFLSPDLSEITSNNFRDFM